MFLFELNQLVGHYVKFCVICVIYVFLQYFDTVGWVF